MNFVERRWILDKDNNIVEVDFMSFIKWNVLTSFERLIVAKDFPNGIEVSTVFVGMPLPTFDKSKILLFETHIFGSCYNGANVRYETWNEALEGHKRVVKEILELG